MTMNAKEHRRIALLPGEQNNIRLDFAPISTLTWFHAPVDVAELRDRAARIILKNSWLAGRLKKDAASRLWGLEYSPIHDLDAAKAVLEEKGLFLPESTKKPVTVNIDPTVHSWIEQTRIIMDAYPDILLQKNEEFLSPFRICKIAVVSSSDGKFVGLVFSVSHAVSDAPTFYKLYEALLGGIDLTSFDAAAERYMGTIAAQERAFGKNETNFMASLGVWIFHILNQILDHLLGWLWPNRFTTVTKIYVIDPAKIVKLKQQTNLPFVSTNDIVTSWYLSGKNLGSMFVNLRGRLPGHTSNLAGYYQGILFYRAADAVSPDLIRQSLEENKRVVTRDQPISGLDALRRWQAHLITNWISLYPNNVDGSCSSSTGTYNTHSHGPVAGVSSVIPSYVALCVLYQSSPSQKSVMVTASPNAHMALDASIFSLD